MLSLKLQAERHLAEDEAEDAMILVEHQPYHVWHYLIFSEQMVMMGRTNGQYL